MMPRSILDPWEVTQDLPTPEDFIRKHLSSHPLYNRNQPVFCKIDDDNIYLNWTAEPIGTCQAYWQTYFHAQITKGKFHLLHIAIDKKYRGTGYGLLLYSLLEKIAQDLGCHTIEQTPSGWTSKKETRMSYVCRKLHYVRRGAIATKKICPNGLVPAGEVCPRCGSRRRMDNGTWVHNET